MAKVRATYTLDDIVVDKAKELAETNGFALSTMLNWLLRRQLGFSGDMEIPQEATNEH